MASSMLIVLAVVSGLVFVVTCLREVLREHRAGETKWRTTIIVACALLVLNVSALVMRTRLEISAKQAEKGRDVQRVQLLEELRREKNDLDAALGRIERAMQDLPADVSGALRDDLDVARRERKNMHSVAAASTDGALSDLRSALSKYARSITALTAAVEAGRAAVHKPSGARTTERRHAAAVDRASRDEPEVDGVVERTVNGGTGRGQGNSSTGSRPGDGPRSNVEPGPIGASGSSSTPVVLIVPAPVAVQEAAGENTSTATTDIAACGAESVTEEVQFESVAGSGHADADVGTEPGKVTTVIVRSGPITVLDDDTGVRLPLLYEVREEGGDHTVLRRIEVVHLLAPSGCWIRSVDGDYGEATLAREYKGRNWLWHDLAADAAVAGLPLSRLRVKFDGSGKDDHGNAQLECTIVVPVVLAPR